jgi:hypothetical protein
MNVLNSILGFLVLLAVLALLASPYALVVLFPEVSESVASISAAAIPWVILLVLFLVFNEGLKSIFESLAGALARVRRVAAGGAVADLDQQESISLTPGQAQELRTHIETLTQQTQQGQNLAQMYYLRYIAVTIYGSQYELLTALEQVGPKSTLEILPYYNTFVSRAPNGANYELNSWLGYLLSNALISFDTETQKYQLGAPGLLFLQEVRRTSYDTSQFPY